MNLRLDITGATDLLRAFVALPQAAEEAVHEAVVDGTGMLQTQARTVHRFISRTGATERSVSTRFLDRMTGEVFLDAGTAPQAVFQHQGTRPHMIFPRNKRVLRWVAGGGFIFARHVNHPGTKPDPFLYDAVEAKHDDIVARFVQAPAIAAKRAGL